MSWDFLFFANSALLGAGLAMDAFSVSLANGLAEPDMRPGRMCAIAGVYALFQIAMPLLGWLCVHTVVAAFGAVERFIPWIALVLLVYIGGKMLRDGLSRDSADAEKPAARLTPGVLIVQGVATSIDALSVGFTIASYPAVMAAVSAAVIGAVTFGLCMIALAVGRRFGTRLADKATIVGGLILIAIGLEIFLRGMLG